MRAKLILNDTHIGVKRVGGTTPVTALELRMWLLEQVRAAMFAHLDKDIVFNGDIFDDHDISLGDALAFYEFASGWLERSGIEHNDRLVDKQGGAPLGGPPDLILGRGNHDISKDSSRLSMFDLITRILKSRFPDRVRIVTEPTLLWPGFFMLPHVINQEIFNIELEKALALEPSYIFIHANYHNNFAAQSDHSLNVSEEQAATLVARGHTLIFGHEHQARRPAAGVIVVGNNFPSSVADCLNNPGDQKECLVLDETYRVIQTWTARGSFAQVDWRDLAGFDFTGLQFIRVTGQASAEEAAKVLQVVSKLRQKSDAFVVASAVKIEGMQDMPELQVEAQEMRAVNVLEYLYENLEPEQTAVVKKLLEAV